jgi:hypothetical protein
MCDPENDDNCCAGCELDGEREKDKLIGQQSKTIGQLMQLIDILITAQLELTSKV